MAVAALLENYKPLQEDERPVLECLEWWIAEAEAAGGEARPRKFNWIKGVALRARDEFASRDTRPTDKLVAERVVDWLNAEEEEKKRRVYYQDIVYSVCNSLEKIFGGSVVCGTVDSPSRQVQELMTKVLENYPPRKSLAEAFADDIRLQKEYEIAMSKR